MVPSYLDLDAFALIQQVRLLLVDPNPAERTRVKVGLGGDRFDVTEAADVDAAMTLLGGATYFDAVVTSYVLGGPKNGVWLLEYVFDRWAGTYRVLTAEKWVPEIDELRLFERGIVSLFKPKPLDPRVLAKYFSLPCKSAQG